jgi:hypothetical protein
MRERGFALIAVVAVGAITLLIASFATVAVVRRMAISGLFEQREEARLAAETGVDRAVVLLARDPNAWAVDGPDCSQESGYRKLDAASGRVVPITVSPYDARVDVWWRPGPPDASGRITLCVRAEGTASTRYRSVSRVLTVRVGRKAARIGSTAFTPGILGRVAGNGIIYGSLFTDGTLNLLGDVAINPDTAVYNDLPSYRNIVAATVGISMSGSAQIGTPQDPMWAVLSPSIVGGEGRIYARVIGSEAPVLMREKVEDVLPSLRSRACTVISGDLELKTTPISLPCLSYAKEGKKWTLTVTGLVVVEGNVSASVSEITWAGNGTIAASGNVDWEAKLLSSSWPDQVPQIMWAGDGYVRTDEDTYGVFVADGTVTLKGPKTTIRGLIGAGGIDMDANPKIYQDLRVLRTLTAINSPILRVAASEPAIVWWREGER